MFKVYNSVAAAKQTVKGKEIKNHGMWKCLQKKHDRSG
jgi:hypothetical protein